ncbi:membrane protein, partial [Elstera litoralis]
QAVFWGYSALMGVSMASIFLVFTGQSIAQVFFISASVFLTAAVYGYTTKKDLTSIGSFLLIGMVGIFIAGIVNIFLGSSMMSMLISMLAVVIFTGLTAFDAQRLKEEYAEGYGHESLMKMSLIGALSLYLNFINIFTALLNLMGDRE